MEFELLGSFQNIMAELTPEELERANDPAPSARDADAEPGADDESALSTSPTESLPSSGVFGGAARGPVSAPPIDERARHLAQRLVGNPGDQPPGKVLGWTIHVEGHPVVPVDHGHPGPIVIGRGAADESPLTSNHLPVDLAVASREHCHISFDGQQAVLSDLGSTNGTVVSREGNSIVVGARSVALRGGDVITTAGGAAVLATIGTIEL